MKIEGIRRKKNRIRIRNTYPGGSGALVAKNGIDMRTMLDMTPDSIPGQIVQIAA